MNRDPSSPSLNGAGKAPSETPSDPPPSGDVQRDVAELKTGLAELRKVVGLLHGDRSRQVAAIGVAGLAVDHFSRALSDVAAHPQNVAVVLCVILAMVWAARPKKPGITAAPSSGTTATATTTTTTQ